MFEDEVIKMDEKAKRLKPTVEVLRELYLKSGNQCAFPGCYNAMVDDNGKMMLLSIRYLSLKE